MDQINQFRNEALEKEGLKETKINGKSYAVKLLPAYQGFAVGMQLIKTFLPAFGSFLDNNNKKEYILPEEESLFTEIAILLVDQMGKINLMDVIQLLLQDVRVDGNQIDVDQHFMGKYSEFVSLLQFALEANFKDFFTGYLKEKGIEIHSLREMVGMSQDQTTQE